MGVSGGISASFVYDGDGNRVKSVIGGVTTTFVGAHFEWSGSTSSMVKYYYAGGERVAMRSGTTLYYLFSDHLGSTSVTATSSGSLHSRQLYKPWGENRWNSGTVPTTFRFTGQRQEASLGGPSGLYDYGARFYDPALGRWIQPDSIVPLQSQGVQAWDRFAYVNNNPVRYNDPSGHDVGCKSRECKQSSYDIPKLATPPAQNDKLASQLSAAAFVLDTAAVVVSGMNLGALYTEGGAVVAAGCAAGPEGCAAGAVYFFALDISLSQIAPTGIAENFLSGTSLVLTSFADYTTGNTAFTDKGVMIGTDTLISARNTILGQIPEVHIDAAVNGSQWKYGYDRITGSKLGGSIPIIENGNFNLKGIFNELNKNWW